MQADGDCSTGRSVAQRVIHKIDQRLFEPLRITENGWNWLGFERQRNLVVICQQSQLIHNFLNQRL